MRNKFIAWLGSRTYLPIKQLNKEAKRYAKKINKIKKLETDSWKKTFVLCNIQNAKYLLEL